MLYQDIYYLYLNFLIPFLVLSFPFFIGLLERRFAVPKRLTYLVLCVIFSVNIILYLSSFQSLQTIPTLSTVIETIQKEKPSVLYGTNDLAPILAYLSNTPLLEKIIDTNENIYRKGLLDKTVLTKKALEQKALIITHGAEYPEFQVNEKVLGGIFNEKEVLEKCKLIQSVPAITEGSINRVNLFRC